jgi:hypothetical protein
MPPASRSAVEEAEVDRIINRHKTRLEQHRRFLDGEDADAYTSPSLDVDPSKWAERQQAVSKAHRQGDTSPRSRHSPPNSPRSQTGTEYLHREPSTFGGQSFTTREAPVVMEAAPMDSRYVTDSPTRMHERAKAWQAAKEQKLMRNADDVWYEQHAECTFQPRTVTREYELAHQAAHYISLVGGGGGAVIDVGEASFIERQRIARERKQEAERRLVPDTTRWKNRVTKPKEFTMNRRETVIPALKKPCFSPARQKQGGGDHTPAIPEITFQEEKKSLATPSAAPSAASETAAKVGGLPQPKTHVGGSPKRSGSVQRTLSAASSARSGGGGQDNAAVSRMLLEKDAIIEDLRNQLDLSRRELEVARNTIRELSLA